MRKLLLSCLFFALAMIPSAAQNKTFIPADKNTVMINGHNVPTFKALEQSQKLGQDANKAQRKSWGGFTQTDDILSEDFSKFTEGTIDEPYETALCDQYGIYGTTDFYINSAYTNTPGWCGSWVFQAGGAAALMDTYGYIGAVLNTPLGDYSGKLTIKFRAKKMANKSASVFINVLKGGYYSPTYATVANPDEYSAGEMINLTGSDGWSTFEIKVHNTDACADGFVQFLSYGCCIIDDIEITCDVTDYIAAPNVTAPTNFTKDGFTANWDPVRRAHNYYLYLYKRVLTSDQDSVINETFENDIPSDWTVSENVAVRDGVGVDGSAAVMLQNGDTIYTPYTFAKYKNFSTWMKVVAPEGSEEELDYAYIYLLTRDENGWSRFGYMSASGWQEEGTLDIDEASGNLFANLYYGVGFTVTGLPDGAYLLIDNVNAVIAPSATLEEVSSIYSIKDNYYTFTDLEPEGEYYYGVQSHYSTLYSTYELQYAFGVSAPEVKEATDVDARGGYTANWEEAPKATRYEVSNYGISSATSDGEYTFLDEDFSGIDNTITSSTDPYSAISLSNGEGTSLDDYASYKGWTGYLNAISQGYLGCEYNYSYVAYLKTPKMSLDKDESFNLTIRALSYSGETLYIVTPNNSYSLTFGDDPTGATYGIIEGTYTIPEAGDNMTLMFYTANGYNFMIDNIKVTQNVEAGDEIRTFLGSAEVEAGGELSHRFTGLDQYDYSTYAYSVTSYFDRDGSTATSDPSDYVYVNLNGGTTDAPTAITTAIRDENASEVQRYTIDGTQVSAPVKGINIIRMSNGTTRKVVVK
ncbi:MAG: hypothetical protein Q4D41_03275 [Prevotellaceae bacterium]|nr:hypothetical protein [Prevotellaceae bacterium]